MADLYNDLTSWYELLDPVEQHLEEATSLVEAFERSISGPGRTLLDLGSGAGNNAFYFKQTFSCTLVDPSEAMLGLSRRRNPECRHLLGDMRTLRLEETFDAVLVHDAVAYMMTEADLRAAMTTAFLHTRPGGAAIFAPDFFAETFCEASRIIEGGDGDRTMRCLDWAWDPDPTDHQYRIDYSLLLREGARMRSVHIHHIEGLFSRPTWLRLLTDVGFSVELIPRPIDDEYEDEVLLCRKE